MGRFARLSFYVPLLFALPVGEARAASRELQILTDDIARLGLTLKNLSENGLEPGAIVGLRSYSERMTDAEILFLLGDYGRASLVLFELVSDQANAQNPHSSKATYYLAESLYQIGNLLSAREQFRALVARGDAEHMRDAVRRLIQIGDRLEQWDGIEGDIARLRQAGGALPSEIAYIYVKSLVRQNKTGEAVRLAAEIPPADPLFAKVSYLAAVALVQAGKLDEAAARFESLTRMEGQYNDLVLVRELSAMNRGRILLEQGKMVASVDAYQGIGIESSMFEEALFEVAWDHVRAAGLASESERDDSYRRAQNLLEILLLSENDNALAPEARLLLGNILLRLGRFDDAMNAFGEVVRRYAPVRDELAGVGDRFSSPEEVFDQLVAGVQRGAAFLPPKAARWTQDDSKLDKATALVAQLEESEAWLHEGEVLVDKLLAALESEQRAQFFPALRDLDLRRREIASSIDTMTARLLAVERDEVEDLLGSEQQSELQKVLRERERLEPEYQKLPKDRAAYESRTSEIKGRLTELSKQAYQLRYPVKTMQAALDAIRSWLAQNAEALDGTDRDGFRERIALQEREVEELIRTQTELEAEITREKTLLGATTAAEAHDDEIRALYGATLEREREILRVAISGSDGKNSEALREIERQRMLLATYRAEIEKFSKRLEEVLTAKSRGVKEQVLTELRLLSEERQAVDETRREARQVIGEVAATAVADVRNRFQDIVLRADVGIVDVAWQLKEEQTHRISGGVSEQKRELSILDSEFTSVLKDE